jgi:hypothetical protein
MEAYLKNKVLMSKAKSLKNHMICDYETPFTSLAVVRVCSYGMACLLKCCINFDLATLAKTNVETEEFLARLVYNST